jgi:hypothetical protein
MDAHAQPQGLGVRSPLERYSGGGQDAGGVGRRRWEGRGPGVRGCPLGWRRETNQDDTIRGHSGL